MRKLCCLNWIWVVSLSPLWSCRFNRLFIFLQTQPDTQLLLVVTVYETIVQPKTSFIGQVAPACQWWLKPGKKIPVSFYFIDCKLGNYIITKSWENHHLDWKQRNIVMTLFDQLHLHNQYKGEHKTKINKQEENHVGLWTPTLSWPLGHFGPGKWMTKKDEAALWFLYVFQNQLNSSELIQFSCSNFINFIEILLQQRTIHFNCITFSLCLCWELKFKSKQPLSLSVYQIRIL